MPVSLDIPDWEPCTAAELAPGEAHLWLAPLVPPDAVLDALAATLAPDEQARAARFHFERDRRSFVAARGALRRILGGYLGLAAEAVAFSYGRFGKPHLAGEAEATSLEFSLSHSGGWALVGVAHGRPIGVDLEAVRTIPDHQALAEANFSSTEARALERLAAERRVEGFFACWTRKEAYAKALGLGLSLELSRFVVPVEPEEGAWTVAADGVGGACRLWGLRPLPGFWAAAALDDADAPASLRKLRLTWR